METNTKSLMDKWQLYMKDVESPQLFIDFGFYYMMAAALQRRVWLPFSNVELYPNLYIILTGPPAIGKGRVITQVKKFIEHHERLKQIPRVEDVADSVDGEEFVDNTMAYTQHKEINEKEKKDTSITRKLFPTLPDSTSLRSLTNFVANNGWQAKYKKGDKYVAYAHCSCAFILEELFNLFREQRETKDISRFLTCAWDCGNFRHETYGNGRDAIINMCVSLIAGTTPEFMKNVVGNDLMNEGFASRTLFIWGEHNRFYKFDFGEITEEQVQAKKDILDHLKQLSTLCGPLDFTPEAYDFAKNWYETELHEMKLRQNHHYKMEHYYGRKKMHLLKLAMAIHFSRSMEMRLELEDVTDAMKVLEVAEQSMHCALGGKGRNQLAGIGAIILMYLKKYGSKTSSQLLFEFAEEVNKQELTEILEFLTSTRQIKAESAGTNVIYTSIK